MSKKIKYQDEPIEAKIIEDLLPSPEQLAFREEEQVAWISLRHSGPKSSNNSS